MHIAYPYSTYEALKEKGISTRCLANTNIEDHDAFTVLVFLKNEEVVRFVEYTRAFGDFSALGMQQKFYDRDHAVFTAYRADFKSAGGMDYYLVTDK